MCSQCSAEKELKWFSKTRGGEKSYYKTICKECEASNRGDRKRQIVELLLSNEERAYLAGLIDGEGHIGLYMGGKTKGSTERRSSGVRWQLRIQITSTNKDIVDWLNLKLKGLSYTSTHDNSVNNDPNRNVKIWKDVHHFIMTSRNGEALLKLIQPYSIIKKKQIEIALEYQSTIGYSGHTFPQWLIDKRINLYKELRALNKRGKHEED